VPGLDKAIAAVWDGSALYFHKHRNLLDDPGRKRP
jgi:hypothetical protein